MSFQRPLSRAVRCAARTSRPTASCLPLPIATRRQYQSSARPSGIIPVPYITEVTSSGWRTSDIFSKLLQERIICLYGSIDDGTAASIVSQLLWLEAENPEKSITLYINSPGGMISSGLAIYDTMTYIRPPVSTVCVGAASSMAALLLVGGEAGQRFALPHSSIMIHQPLGGTQGQATDILIYANQIQRVRDQVNEIYRRHVNKALGGDKFDRKMVSDLMERDKYLTPDEAKELGIIDEILTKRPVPPVEGQEGNGGSDGKKS